MQHQYTEVEVALEEIKRHVCVKDEYFELSVEDSIGMVSAANIISERDWPEEDMAHMDGYAVSFDGGNRFRIVGEIKPGFRRIQRINKGEAAYIVTGSSLPIGADAIVRIEECKVDGKFVLVEQKPEKGKYIYRKGSDFKRGTIILRKGERIKTKHIPALLALGYEKIKVKPPLKVSVFATGNELSDRNEKGKIRNTHSPMIINLLRENGCIPKYFGIIEDDEGEIASEIKKVLKESDMIILTGGTSMGKKDMTVSAIRSLKPEVMFHGVKMDRGRVTCVSSVEGRPVLAMPGPVQATMNALIIFSLPLIKHMMDVKEDDIEVQAKLQAEWKARSGFEDFTKVLYVKLYRKNGMLMAEPITGPTESMRVLFESNGVVIIPSSIKRLKKGSNVSVRLVKGLSF
jgi:molybdopterin molybdotransferase